MSCTYTVLVNALNCWLNECFAVHGCSQSEQTELFGEGGLKETVPKIASFFKDFVSCII